MRHDWPTLAVLANAAAHTYVGVLGATAAIAHDPREQPFKRAAELESVGGPYSPAYARIVGRNGSNRPEVEAIAAVGCRGRS